MRNRGKWEVVAYNHGQKFKHVSVHSNLYVLSQYGIMSGKQLKTALLKIEMLESLKSYVTWSIFSMADLKSVWDLDPLGSCISRCLNRRYVSLTVSPNSFMGCPLSRRRFITSPSSSRGCFSWEKKELIIMKLITWGLIYFIHISWCILDSTIH